MTPSLRALNRISEVRAIIAKLFKLIVREPLMLFAQLPSIAILVCPPEPEPEKGVDAGAETHHAEGNGVATDEAWSVKRRARITVVRSNVVRMQRDASGNSLYKGGHDSGCVAEGKLHTCGSRSLAVPRGVIR